MMCPVAQCVLNMGGETSADSRRKIGNIVVTERDLIDRDFTRIFAKCGGHSFKTALRKNTVMASTVNEGREADDGW